MTWVTWRQFRSSALAVLGALAVAAILLALTPQAKELTSCAGQAGCPLAAGKLLGIGHVHLLQYLSTLLVALPVIVGAFWGAPLLAHELETGTFRLAWTQSVTRARWFVTKIGLLGVSCAAVCGALSLMLGAWSSAAVNADRLLPAMFAQRGIVPIGYALFGFALGVTAGLLIRRTLPAIIVTLVGFVAVRVMVQFWLRPRLLPLSHASFPIGRGLGLELNQSAGAISILAPSVGRTGTWPVTRQIVDASGNAPTQAFLQHACRLPPPPPHPPGVNHLPVTGAAQRALNECTAHVAARFHVAVAYQPASHYWGLQWAETGIFVGLALALLGFSYWWLRRCLT